MFYLWLEIAVKIKTLFLPQGIYNIAGEAGYIHVQI